MALIAEVQCDSPTLGETLARVPGMVLSVEGFHCTENGRTRGYYWAEGDDFETFEAAIADDPTVTNLGELTDTGSRRLYRIDFTERGMTTIPEWWALDITLIEGKATRHGWSAVLRCPDRETVHDYFELEHEIGNSPDLIRIYREQSDHGIADSELSPAQRSALLTAYKSGYFNVPRDSTQEAVARQLDISAQSLSERLRRGVSSLIASTVSGDGI